MLICDGEIRLGFGYARSLCDLDFYLRPCSDLEFANLSELYLRNQKV